jgi:uncharacterized protein
LQACSLRAARPVRAARHLSERQGALNIVFAAAILAVALYMLVRSLSVLL